MYQISDDKFEAAWELAGKGESIRNIAEAVGIAKQTAQDIYQGYRQYCDDLNLEYPKVKIGYWSHKKHRNLTNG